MFATLEIKSSINLEIRLNKESINISKTKYFVIYIMEKPINTNGI